MKTKEYEDFIRTRITELRIRKNVAEHRMSLDLDKSPSYIRGITSGQAMPSVKGLIRIIRYFDMTLAEFCEPLNHVETPLRKLCDRLHKLNIEELEKVNKVVNMIVQNACIYILFMVLYASAYFQ